MTFVTPDRAKPIATFCWRRLDQPGHDCCGLLRLSAGWKLQGMAVFLDAGQPCSFAYEVSVDSTWTTRSARITGLRGEHLQRRSAPVSCGQHRSDFSDSVD
jgi:hypothetical protein